jgi:LysR family glycine cleavage system transcriptional activator
LELTEEGALLAAHVERGLGAIRAGLDQVAARAGSVKVALLPMFASRWLSPRLGGLLEMTPVLQLSIQNHNNAYAGLRDPESFADLGIQWGRGDWDNFHVTRLWPEKLVVVCSPAYLRAHPIRTPADIERCTLLHVDDETMWAEWFARNGLQPPPVQSRMMLEDRHFQLSSTINGLGVSLFASWLVQRELQDGELVDPFEQEFDTSFAYHLIEPKGAELPDAARHFKDWLLGLTRAL